MDAAIRCSEGTFDQKIAPISATEVAGAEDTTDSEDDSSSSDDSEE